MAADTKALPCVVCHEPLDGLSEDYNHPSGGTEFMSGGHYGSRVWDPMDGTYIAINVCDGCLDEARETGLIGHYTAGRRRDGGSVYSAWPPLRPERN